MKRIVLGSIAGVVGLGLFVTALAMPEGIAVAPVGMIGTALMTVAGVVLATPRWSHNRSAT